MIANREELKRLVRACVRHTAAVDVCSGIPWRNLVAPRQTGPDALLTDEALLRLAGRYLPESPDAQGVYHALFLEHSPIGADAQRALAAMKQWGLNPAVRNLDALRAQWKALHEYSRVSDGLDAAGVSSLAVRVGLFEDDAPELSELDERLHAMLDVTPLFALEDCWTELASRGASDRDTLCALIASRGRALAARSLYVGPDARWDGRMVEGCLLPTCRELGVRLVLDGLSPRRWRVEGARHVARRPCAEADALGFLPDAPTLCEACGRRGWSLTPYCSAQVTTLEHLPAAWHAARRAVAEALTEMYARTMKTGWRLAEGEVAHDIERLLGGE